MALDLQTRVVCYTEPPLFLAMAFLAFLHILICIVLERNWNDLVSPRTLSDRSFAELWLRLGPIFAKREEESPVPKLVASARGIILEIGPGCGTQIPRFTKDKVIKIYGSEPTLALHPALRAKAVQARIEDKYEVLPCAADDLEGLKRYGIVENSMDTILSMQVLCSVADEHHTAKGLYKLLKPGGEFIVFEHMKSPDRVTRAMQELWSWPWSVALGGCKLKHETMDAVINAGSWKRIELDGDYKVTVSMFPRVWGRLVKADGTEVNQTEA